MLYPPVFTPPEPTPTVTPMPDISQVTDFSAAISGFLGAALLVVAGLAYRQARIWFGEVIADVKVTKSQTTNDHDTNMRDDITKALSSINDVANSVEKLDKTVCAMHDDLRESRKDVRFNTEYIRDVDKRLNEYQRKRDQGGSDG